MFADALPIPQAELAKPESVPAVASDTIEAVIIDVGHSRSEGVSVRLYDESFSVSAARVLVAYVLYGPGVRRLARELEAEWAARRIPPVSREDVPRMVRWTHRADPRDIQEAIEALQRRHLP